MSTSLAWYVFISYSHEDKTFVDNLVYDLLEQGCKVWIDNLGIRPGTPDWQKAIEDGIACSNAVILISSPNAAASPYVWDELQRAKKYQRVIYPLLIAGNNWTDSLPMGFGRVQGIDARDRYPQALQQLVAVLKGAPLSQVLYEDEDLKQKMTMRGITLLKAIENVGLVDIESRDDKQRPLPPWQFYELADCEIAITGVTLLRAFNQHIQVLLDALAAGKKVFALLLHPRSSEVKILASREKGNVRSQIEEVLTVIRANGLDKESGFHIKFIEKRPPFTAIMIDGDISSANNPSDQKGQIRVQPGTAHGIQKNGIILQFKKLPDDKLGAFNYFAEDLRKQWQTAKEMNDAFRN